MRVIIIGAVAAGTSAATEIRRNHKDWEIIVYEKDTYISYVGCGMPFYISDEADSFVGLVPRGPEAFKEKDIDIFIQHEVLSIDPGTRTLTVQDLATDRRFEQSYDKLIIATGATARKPEIKGVDQSNVFILRNINHMIEIDAFIENQKPKKAAVIGGGFIGMEMVEAFRKLGMEVHLIARSSISKGIDKELTKVVEDHLKEQGVKVYTSATIEEINGKGLVLADGTAMEADIVLVATGIAPTVDLARQAGVELGGSGAIKVDKYMQTNLVDVYSCGDCIEVFHAVTGRPMYRPLGTTANKTGIIAGTNVSGIHMKFRGVLGTGIYRIFDMTVGQTGLSQEEAEKQGYDVVAVTTRRLNKTDFMGGRPIWIKLVADSEDGRLLGAQVIGYEGVDKRLDVLETAITLNGRAEDLMYMDLGYSPPYSSARDPIYYAAVKLIAALDNNLKNHEK